MIVRAFWVTILFRTANPMQKRQNEESSMRKEQRKSHELVDSIWIWRECAEEKDKTFRKQFDQFIFYVHRDWSNLITR